MGFRPKLVAKNYEIQMKMILNSIKYSFLIKCFVFTFWCNFSTNLFGQCPTENISYTLQSEVDNFKINYPNCEEISVHIELTGDDINNVDGFSNLIKTFKSLAIKETTKLRNLNGFQNLEEIWNHLNIDKNEALESLEGLENLTLINGWLAFTANPNLESLKALESLSGKVSGGLNIWSNPKLTKLQGLEGLTKIDGFFNILGNTGLINVSGLEYLDSLNGFLKINNNENLEDISALANLDPTTINYESDLIDDLTIKFNPKLESCDLESFCNFFEMQDASIAIDISENGEGCNSELEVTNACNGINTSNQNIRFESKFKLAPMPFVETINIKMEHHEKIAYSIFSLSGKLLGSGFINQVNETIETTHLTSGSYIFQLKDSKRAYSRLIVKL